VIEGKHQPTLKEEYFLDFLKAQIYIRWPLIRWDFLILTPLIPDKRKRFF